MKASSTKPPTRPEDEVRENVRLRGQIAAMQARITELEKTLEIEREYIRDMRKGQCPF